MRKVGGIILAAGEASRFGEAKQLLDWRGKRLVAHMADQALNAGLDPVSVVVGHRAQEVQAALAARPVQVAMNWRWKDGLSTSLQAGLTHLRPETEAAIVIQCDQPLLTTNLLRALVSRFEESDASIVYPTHAGQRGTPTLFDRRLFPELAAVRGDVGGRGVIADHREAAATVEVDDPNVLIDIDTPQDYARLKSMTRDAPPDLQAVRHLIIDMDGVLWCGDEPMAGLPAFFEMLERRGIDFILATNNSSRTPQQYAQKLARFGVQVSADHILTSALVAAAYLRERAKPGSRIYVIGKTGLRQALQEQGFVLAEEDVENVVVGWDTDLTWEQLATAGLLINQGAGFIGTNPDVNYPTERGLVPGNGAQLAALEVTTGVSPIVTGKPEAQMYIQALQRMDARPETTAVIGDRLSTDLLGGQRLGLTTILVLSGIIQQSDLDGASLKPDVVCEDIRAVAVLLDR